MLAAPVLEYRLAGPRFTLQSRRCLERIYTLAFLYRLDGKKLYLERAVRELRAAASFNYWTEAPLADTAEMTHAFAIGYDWLYTALDPADREWMRAAMVDKGISPALSGYERQNGWFAGRSQWNPMANAGIVLAALALAGEEADKSRAVLRFAIDSLPRAMTAFGPDGGWTEGRSYWRNAMRNAVLLLAGLDSALGTDFGLSAAKGFEKAGRFRIYASGPTGAEFDFADDTEPGESAPHMFWLARRFGEPVYSWYEQRVLETSTNPDPLDLIWYQTEARAPKPEAWPLTAVFSGVQAAFLRSGWDDPNAIFIALKAGDNKLQPNHRDLGSFVLDAGAVRWALDLGRSRLGLHNGIVLDDQNQDPRAEAVLSHPGSPAAPVVDADLSRVYPQKVKQYLRHVALVQGQQVVIEDTLRAEQPVDALWGMLTDAEATVNGQTAELKKGGWTLALEIVSPRHAVFDVREVGPESLTTPGPAVHRLIVRLGEKVSELNLKVTLTPYRTGQPRTKIPVTSTSE
jgi:hypothetical protein